MIKNLRLSISLFLLFFCVNSLTHAQEGTMVAYFATQNITGIAEEAGYLWHATHGGLIKYDTTTGAVTESFNTFNSDIPTNYLHCIAIDKEGNKWIGSDIGIIKFTGDSWEHYPNSETGLLASYVYNVAVDTTGNVWAGNYFGVIINDGTGWELFDDAGIGFNLSGIDEIVCDKQGNVWFTHERYFIDKFDGEQWTRYSNVDLGIADMLYPTLEVDDEGNAWVMTDLRLHKFDGNQWTSFPRANAGIPNSYAIDCGPGNLVWCSYGGKKISSFNGSEWNRYSPVGFPENANDIIASDNGIVWCATDNGLFKFDNGIWTRINTSEVAFSNNLIKDIEIDATGKKWIIDGNLNSFDSVWEHHLSSGILNKAKMDLEGNLWLGSMDGVFLHDSTLEMPIMPTSWIKDISMGPSGEICFASGFTTGSLGILKDSTWTFYTEGNSPIDGPISSATFDDNGIVWFSDSRGLRTFDGLNWTTYSIYNSDIPFDLMHCMAFKNEGIKYFGSSIYGLARFDGINWEHIDKSNSPLTDNQIMCLKFDNLGNLWIGTKDGGIFYTNGEHWWSLNMANSALPSNYILDIEFEGNIKWIGTHSGLVSYDGTGELLATIEPIELRSINVYPNPAMDIIRVDPPMSSVYNISIINIQGNIIQSYTSSTTTLNIKSLSPGFYIIRITSEKGCYLGKFIKQ